MKKWVFGLAVFIATIFPVSIIYASAALDELIDKTDAIAVVEILSTDYTATAADGPMYAEAKVLKVLKGNISSWRKLDFSETGWWSPNYKKGERRIVFLNKVKANDDYYKAKWHTTYTGSVDFFFDEDALDKLSLASLAEFLKKIQAASSIPPEIEYVIIKQDSNIKLSVKLINKGDYASWINPSKMGVSFETNNIHYSRAISWVHYKQNSWIKIESKSSITGYMDISLEEIKGEAEIKLILSHRSMNFPYSCWVGAKSVTVRLRN